MLLIDLFTNLNSKFQFQIFITFLKKYGIWSYFIGTSKIALDLSDCLLCIFFLL